MRETRLAATCDLEVNARPNGGITVRGRDRDEVLVRARVRDSPVEGELQLSTTNGFISPGSVRGRTTNGLDVRLSGDRWNGSGLDLETTNGGVTLTVPEN